MDVEIGGDGCGGGEVLFLILGVWEHEGEPERV